MAEQALDGLKVLDLGRHIAGPYCAKLLADYGAEVVKVEPPGGDPARRAGPFPGDRPAPEASGLFFYLNHNKKSIVLDLETPGGRSDLTRLARWADVLVESFSPRVMPSLGLGYDALAAVNPRLVMTSISAFGQSGPYRDYKATDIVLQALSGWMLYRGDPRREPVRAGGRLGISEFIGGAYGAAATLSALIQRRRTRHGQHVDVSLLEADVNMMPFPLLGERFAATIWPPVRMIHAPCVEECRDGYIGLNVLTGQHWADLCRMIGIEDWAENPDYALIGARVMRFQEVKARMRPWLMARTRQEILEEGTAWKIPVAMVHTPQDVLKSDHFRARGYLVEVEHPVLGKVTQPGAPFSMSETPWRIRRPAPRLGEHDEEIRGQLVGQREGVAEAHGQAVAQGRREDVGEAHPRAVVEAPRDAATGDGGLASGGRASLPLEGVRVCALTCFWAGPHATAYLGALGAEVIKVEAIQAVDGWRWPQIRCEKWWEKSGYWCGTNVNQYGITLDLGRPRGRELFKRLIAKSDVVIDNFPPRVMENFQLGYPVLKEVKPDIIAISMPGYGSTGPWRDFTGFAHAFDQASGLAHITGYADDGPMVSGPTADPMAGIHAAFAVQAALEHRRRTGRGQRIELAQLEVLTAFLGPAILDYVMNGRIWGRWGNRDPAMAPHNVYRCKGDDSWAVVAIGSDEEWRALCRAISTPEWTEDERFATACARAANQDEADRGIEAWTSQRDPYEVMHALQAAGVPAGAVTDAVRLDEEPHLRERRFWVELERSLVGRHPYPGFPVRFSEMSMRFRPAPTLGEHNEYVLGEILGLSRVELEELERERIIGTEPIQQGLAI